MPRHTVVLSKITKVFYQSGKPDVHQYLELFNWYQKITKMTHYFHQKSERLSGILARKEKSMLLFEPRGSVFDLHVTNPISMALYQLFKAYDDLMCCMQACYQLKLIKRHSVVMKQNRFYKRHVLRIITKISQFDLKQQNDQVLTEENKKTLLLASQCEVMPVLFKEGYQSHIPVAMPLQK